MRIGIVVGIVMSLFLGYQLPISIVARAARSGRDPLITITLAAQRHDAGRARTE